jgi:hypothetical protein
MSNFNVCICPGCGEPQAIRNKGCKDCGWNGPDGTVKTIAEFLAAPSYPADGAWTLNDVSPAFLAAVVRIAQAAS